MRFRSFLYLLLICELTLPISDIFIFIYPTLFFISTQRPHIISGFIVNTRILIKIFVSPGINWSGEQVWLFFRMKRFFQQSNSRVCMWVYTSSVIIVFQGLCNHINIETDCMYSMWASTCVQRSFAKSSGLRKILRNKNNVINDFNTTSWFFIRFYQRETPSGSWYHFSTFPENQARAFSIPAR